MAPQLKNALAFNLAAGATAILPHNLNNGQLDLTPDIVFVPSADLNVSADDQAVTLVNQGGSLITGSILVESWHTIERAFGAASNTALAPQPYIVVSAEGGNEPPQPVFGNSEVTIYARLTGSDATGDGTLAKPYRTFQRAIRDVPSIVPAGTIYKVDITNLGTETLPDQYEFPVFIGSEGIGNFDFAEEYFTYYSSVMVIATPKIATLASGITTIPAAVSSTPTASTALIKLTVAGAGWTAGDLVGKFCISSGSPNEHSVIWQNTATEIYLTTKTLPTFPLEIRECSAGFEAQKDPNDLHRAAVNITNTQVMLGGIKVRSLSAGAGQFGGWSLQIAGNTPPTSIQFCDIKGGGLVGISWVRTRQCYLKDTLFLMAPLVATQTFYEGAIEVVPAGPRITVWGGRGLDSMLKQCVVKDAAPIHFRDLFDNFLSAPVGLLELLNVQVLDSLSEFPNNAGVDDTGVYWTGARLYLTNVDISRSAAGALGIAALTVSGNGAWAQLSNVTGTNYDVGCTVEDGGLVVLRGTVTLTGVTEEVTVGNTLTGLSWPATNYPIAGSSIVDFTGVDAQGARVVRKA